jgi:hypothetical protein
MWAAVAAQVIALAQLTGLLKLSGIDAGVAGDVVAGVLQILVLFGVLNSPTSADKF